MTSNHDHQNAHGFGQIEKQLHQQAEAASELQGSSETDQAVAEAAHRDAHTSLDELADTEE